MRETSHSRHMRAGLKSNNFLQYSGSLILISNSDAGSWKPSRLSYGKMENCQIDDRGLCVFWRIEISASLQQHESNTNQKIMPPTVSNRLLSPGFAGLATLFSDYARWAADAVPLRSLDLARFEEQKRILFAEQCGWANKRLDKRGYYCVFPLMSHSLCTNQAKYLSAAALKQGVLANQSPR